MSDWWRNMRPTQQLERNGTAREHRYSDEPKAELRNSKSTRRCVTEGRKDRRSETADPDATTRWNSASDASSNHGDAATLPQLSLSTGAESVSIGLACQKWGLVPGEEDRDKLLRDPVQGEMKVSWAELEFDDGNPESTQSPQSSLPADRSLSHTRHFVEAKKEIRRQRRSLKESGDNLGTQGTKPETGQFAMITPASRNNRTVSKETERRINALRQALKTARRATMQTERRVERLLLTKEKAKLERIRKEKQALTRHNQDITWLLHAKQWSSAQEPGLSPIAQSQRSCTPPTSSAYEGQLIDLASPEIRPATGMPLEEALYLDPSEGTPKSRTVIYTPHRRSLDGGSSAAQELFENGISFDHIDPPETGRIEIPGCNVLETHQESNTKLSSLSSRGLETRKDPNDSEQADGETRTRAYNGSEKLPRRPLLDISSSGEAASQGSALSLMPRPLPTTDRLNQEKYVTLRRRISLISKRCKGRIWKMRVSPRTGSPIPVSMTSHRSHRVAAVPEGEAHRSVDENTLRDLSPTKLFRKLKKDPELIERHVSAHIPTTTVLDRPTCGLNQTKDPREGEGKDSTWKPTESMAFNKSQSPSSLLRLTQEGPVPMDITSTAGEQGMGSAQCKVLPTSTSVQDSRQTVSPAEVTDIRMENNLNRLIERCPGAYPSHLDVVADTVVRFERTNLMAKPKGNPIWAGPKKSEKSVFCRTVREFLFIVRSHIVVMMRVYWALAGPVFDSSSDYWLRNKKGEATLIDGVSFLLALPGAFLGMIVLVNCMRLVAHAGAHVRDWVELVFFLL